ncbi:MAG TPA: ABC transporter permease [Polyangiaceae bacterium]|nr:ABC transporter permease [Polyangiaceae bacterium]
MTAKTATTTAAPRMAPWVRRLVTDDPIGSLKKLAFRLAVPLGAFIVFLLVWTAAAHQVVTKYGTLPTPAAVWHEWSLLLEDHRATRVKEREFYAEQAQQITQLKRYVQIAEAKASTATTEAVKLEFAAKAANFAKQAQLAERRRFSSSPTYLDQIFTSLKTVFAGFLIASLTAIPLGILSGMSRTFQLAISPMIQIFKPVSPLAWLPIVMIVVGALYRTDPSEAWFEKSFISSAVTVALCSLWPTLVNTAIGVNAIDKDHVNVARVLNLDWSTRVRKIVLPSSLPYIFAGLRISLSVGWMVLIAAEMLAQNPGLGKFVWDMFQNGSSATLARIMVAVFTIGIIGFLLDRVMLLLQSAVSYQGASS